MIYLGFSLVIYAQVAKENETMRGLHFELGVCNENLKKLISTDL